MVFFFIVEWHCICEERKNKIESPANIIIKLNNKKKKKKRMSKKVFGAVSRNT